MEGARLAEDADVAAVAGLLGPAAAALAEVRGGALFLRREGRRDDADAYVRGVLADGSRDVVVGTLDDVVLGFVVVAVEDLADGGRLGRIDDLYVEPEARDVGVGEAMMEVVLRWCSERGCLGVDAPALPGERRTKNFFEAHGFTARLLVVHKRLGAP